MEKIDNQRQTNYIIAINDKYDKFAVENSIDEAKKYVQMFPDRKAVVIGETYRNDELKKIAFNQVQAFKRGEVRLVDLNKSENLDAAINIASGFLKNGLIVMVDSKISGETIENLFKRINRNQDIIIHRNSIAWHKSELDYIDNEIEKCNESTQKGIDYKPQRNVFFRIHGMANFEFNKEYFIKLINTYGQEIGGLIFICKYILFKKSLEFRKYLESECKKYNQTFDDFIDPYYFTKDSSNFVYLNLITKRIIGADDDLMLECQEEIKTYFSENAAH